MRFVARHVLAPVIAFGAILALIVALDLDVRVADAFHDFAHHEFPARHAFWADDLLHSRGRDLIALVGVGALVALVASAWSRMRSLRWPAAYVLMCLAVGAGGIAAWKSTSTLACPSSYDRWGGSVPLSTPLRTVPSEFPPGHCFPGGHSSGAWSLFSLYFIARARGARWPAAWLAPALVLGTAFSVAQWARGAHFPSHDLVSAAACWLVCVGLHAVLRGRLQVTAR